MKVRIKGKELLDKGYLWGGFLNGTPAPDTITLEGEVVEEKCKMCWATDGKHGGPCPFFKDSPSPIEEIEIKGTPGNDYLLKVLDEIVRKINEVIKAVNKLNGKTN